jgi:hypothetical protein
MRRVFLLRGGRALGDGRVSQRALVGRSALLCVWLACLCSCMSLVGASLVGAAIASPLGRAARTISLSESAHLRLTSKSGFTLNEQGTTTGSIDGTMYIHLHVSNNHGGVTAEVSIYPHGGSLSGNGSATYEVDGAYAKFSGRLSITRGSGSYAGSHGSGLSFSGTIERRNDAVAVQLSGPLSV